MLMWHSQRDKEAETEAVFGGNTRRAPEPVSDKWFSDGRAKLTPGIVEAACAAHLSDPKLNSVAKLAKQYGVTRMTMHRAIERGRQWGRRTPPRALEKTAVRQAARIEGRQAFCSANCDPENKGFNVAE